jgi:hypothetical protein
MSVWEHLAEWGGMPVHSFMSYEDTEAAGIDDAHLASLAAASPDADAVAWRLATHFDATLELADVFSAFRRVVDTKQVRALVFGYWDTDILSGSPGVVDLLCAHADEFPALRHLFVGDIIGEEHEVSWIPGDDIGKILAAFPRLRDLGFRFGQDHARPDLVLPAPVEHAHLRGLSLQTGGLPGAVTRNLARCGFPALERLELWLGVEAYGGDTTIADLAGVLDGSRFPALRHLGLMNSEIQDEVAAALAAAPVVARLDSLDLSMGMLSDTGAEALLSGQPLTHLKRFTVRHHFVGDTTARRLCETLRAGGVSVDFSEPCTPWSGARTPQEGRYTQVSE